MHLTIRATYSLLLSVILPVSLAGQTVPSVYQFIETKQEAGAFIGTLTMGSGRFGFGPKGGLLIGGRYAIEISGPFSMEGVVGYSPGTRDLIDPSRVEGKRVVGEVDALLTTVDLRLKFSLTGDRTWHGLSPFIVTGGGIAFDLAGEDEAEQDLLQDDRFKFGTSFMGVLGTGIRYFPSKRFMIRSDMGLTLWQIDTPRGYVSPERDFENVGDSQWTSGIYLTFGAAWRF
jgi:hypothetical protein